QKQVSKMPLQYEIFDTGNPQVDSALTLLADFRALLRACPDALSVLNGRAMDLAPGKWSAQIERTKDASELALIREYHRETSLKFIRALLVERSARHKLRDRRQRLSDELIELLKLYHNPPPEIPYHHRQIIQSAVIQIHGALNTTSHPDS